MSDAINAFFRLLEGRLGLHPDIVAAADIAEWEAIQRYRAGMNRSALLVVILNLALRQQTAAKFSPRTQILQDMKAVLLARLGGNGRPSNASPGLAAAT